MTYNLSRVTTFLSMLFLALALGCAPTETRRAPGQTIDDAGTTARVKAALAQSQGIKDALAINVDTYRGVVQLAGFVDSQQEAQAAVEAARAVDGVKSVKNALQTKPRPQ